MKWTEQNGGGFVAVDGPATLTVSPCNDVWVTRVSLVTEPRFGCADTADLGKALCEKHLRTFLLNLARQG